MVAPEFIQEDETAGKSEVDSLKISIQSLSLRRRTVRKNARRMAQPKR